jgi:hypothetical protein
MNTVFGYKRPKLNEQKIAQLNGQEIRCVAKMVGAEVTLLACNTTRARILKALSQRHPINRTRKFIVKYALDTDTVSIVEERIPNSGTSPCASWCSKGQRSAAAAAAAQECGAASS